VLNIIGIGYSWLVSLRRMKKTFKNVYLKVKIYVKKLSLGVIIA